MDLCEVREHRTLDCDYVSMRVLVEDLFQLSAHFALADKCDLRPEDPRLVG